MTSNVLRTYGVSRQQRPQHYKQYNRTQTPSLTASVAGCDRTSFPKCIGRESIDCTQLHVMNSNEVPLRCIKPVIGRHLTWLRYNLCPSVYISPGISASIEQFRKRFQASSIVVKTTTNFNDLRYISLQKLCRFALFSNSEYVHFWIYRLCVSHISLPLSFYLQPRMFSVISQIQYGDLLLVLLGRSSRKYSETWN